jgi:hypothetical protein
MRFYQTEKLVVATSKNVDADRIRVLQYEDRRTPDLPRASKRVPAKENQHTAADDEGWMVSGQKILFCWVLVPKLTMVVRLSCYLNYYLFTD